MKSFSTIMKFIAPAILLTCCLGIYLWKYGTPWEEAEFTPIGLTGNDSEFTYFSLNTGGDNVSFSGSLEDLAANVDLLLEGSDDEKEKAFNLMHSVQNEYKHKAAFLWRYAKAAFMVSQIEASRGSPDMEKELVYEAQLLAEDALKLNTSNAEIHKWYAITLGKLGDYESTSTKISNGYKFKDHIDQAIKLNPADPNSYYLLGRWCYGVYDLSWFERKLAATLFSNPPTSTIDEALENFMKAQQRKPDVWKENMLYIAKCYIEKSNYSEAVNWLDKAVALPIISQDDRESQVELESLISSYSGYRQ